MKVKVSELCDTPLAWAVAKILQLEVDDTEKTVLFYEGEPFLPDTYWHQGGPIIEREGINLDNYGKNPRWSAWTPAPDRESGEAQAYGPTPLIAAMRCFVASKLGDEVEIPEELK